MASGENGCRGALGGGGHKNGTTDPCPTGPCGCGGGVDGGGATVGGDGVVAPGSGGRVGVIGSVVDGLMLFASFWRKRVKRASRRSSGVETVRGCR